MDNPVPSRRSSRPLWRSSRRGKGWEIWLLFALRLDAWQNINQFSTVETKHPVEMCCTHFLNLDAWLGKQISHMFWKLCWCFKSDALGKKDWNMLKRFKNGWTMGYKKVMNFIFTVFFWNYENRPWWFLGMAYGLGLHGVYYNIGDIIWLLSDISQYIMGIQNSWDAQPRILQYLACHGLSQIVLALDCGICFGLKLYGQWLIAGWECEN